MMAEDFFLNLQMRHMQRTSERFARDILAITSPSSSLDTNSNLPDILQTAVRQVSIMRIGHTSQGHQVNIDLFIFMHHVSYFVFSHRQDTSFDLDTIPTYGF